MFDTLAKTTGLFFDTARVEATDGVPQLIKLALPGRVLFGTHAPFLVPEAALIRVNESGLLDDKTLRCVLSQNAEQLMGSGNA
jgi:predicted TIM-barrel fold metal-dependent hydrolase